MFFLYQENGQHGFYRDGFAPNGAIELTEEEGNALYNGLSSGTMMVEMVDGKPSLAPIPPRVPTAIEKIAAIEAQITPRRLREAALTAEGLAWLQEKDGLIAELRAQI